MFSAVDSSSVIESRIFEWERLLLPCESFQRDRDMLDTPRQGREGRCTPAEAPGEIAALERRGGEAGRGGARVRGAVDSHSS